MIVTADAAITGGRVFENRYGRDRCLRMSMISFFDAVTRRTHRRAPCPSSK